MEKLLQAIKNKIKNYKTDLATNLLSKGVNDIQEFKRVYGYGQGLDKSLEIINETIKKYQKGDIEDDD
jgi:serine phosphatase RsbU (regulator of sigma subunit)